MHHWYQFVIAVFLVLRLAGDIIRSSKTNRPGSGAFAASVLFSLFFFGGVAIALQAGGFWGS